MVLDDPINFLGEEECKKLSVSVNGNGSEYEERFQVEHRQKFVSVIIVSSWLCFEIKDFIFIFTGTALLIHAHEQLSPELSQTCYDLYHDIA